MAEKRMFTQKIIDSDAFLDMPLSTQALYFHLSMRADDDGFINNPKKIQRMVGGSDDDLKLLVAKRFIIPFESGIVVIKHWKIHNYIRADRYKETVYKDEKASLALKENGAYTACIPSGIPNGDQMETQYRVGKESIEIGKESIEGDTAPAKRKRFTPPTLGEVSAYCTERKNGIDPQAFIDYYSARGWKLGKETMKDWKAAVRTWENRRKGDQPARGAKYVRNEPIPEWLNKNPSADLERMSRMMSGMQKADDP